MTGITFNLLLNRADSWKNTNCWQNNPLSYLITLFLWTNKLECFSFPCLFSLVLWLQARQEPTCQELHSKVNHLAVFANIRLGRKVLQGQTLDYSSFPSFRLSSHYSTPWQGSWTIIWKLLHETNTLAYLSRASVSGEKVYVKISGVK
jgi:hypothetical protein